MPDTRVAVLAEARTRLPREAGRLPFVVLLDDPHLALELYAPRGVDVQTPHTRDELYIVAGGSGTFVREVAGVEERVSFGPNDVLFAAAGERHRFEDFSDDFETWVIFYGPEK